MVPSGPRRCGNRPAAGKETTMASRERDMEHEREDGKAKIKVTDRRLFTREGEKRREIPEEEGESADASRPGATRSSGTSEERAGGQGGFDHRPVREPEGVDFTMLINAMAQPALLFLGEIPDPASGKPTVDLVQARLQIDMLDLLRVKCRGNLSQEEEGLLERVLYQLRMRYVDRSSRPRS